MTTTNDLLSPETISKIERLRGRDPDIDGLLRHAAALQVQLDAAYHEGRISGLTSQLIGQHEHAEVVERIVSDFKARVIEALRQVDWELADNVTIIEMIQKLSTTTEGTLSGETPRND